MFPDKALAANISVFSRPIALAMKLKKNFVLTSKPLSSSINIIINQLHCQKMLLLNFSGCIKNLALKNVLSL